MRGFQFNLGMSGKYFQHGNDEENEGDMELIKNASQFRWFCHTWAHKQPHQVDNVEDMKQQSFLNMKFAEVSTTQYMKIWKFQINTIIYYVSLFASTRCNNHDM